MSKEKKSNGLVPIKVALAGNPNSGKTTIFNELVGARQHVGNYPGVTVEQKEGRFRHEGHEFSVIDLPGTYSLTAYSVEERVARNVVLEEQPDVVVDVIDASNLERNLYLATQFMELNVPLVLALNMSDVAEARGYDIDIDNLSRLLGISIVQTVGHKAEGLEELKRAILETARSGERPARVKYGDEVERELKRIVPELEKETKLTEDYAPRWTAVKLLEDDEEVRELVARQTGRSEEIFDLVQSARQHINRDFGEPAELVLANQRYGFISGACQESVRATVESRHQLSDLVDIVVTNRVLGLPIFLALMYVVFKITFTASEPLMEVIEMAFGWLGRSVAGLWPAGSESVLQSLLVDGIIGGVGGVLIFLPNIFILFLAISILEDSGYMARAAFVMDKIMHRIGLHGKSFIPMLIGFGCTVPAILATRTLESRRDRLITMLALPLMSCSARLAIYALFIPAFFPAQWRAPVLWAVYLTGILLAAVVIKLLRVTVFSGEETPFVLELPPYRLPTFKGALIHTWDRAWMFVRKAGTIIVGASIILWAVTTYPKPPADELEGMTPQQVRQKELAYSTAGQVGQVIEPIMRPVGFDWKTSTALLGAFAAKELFVSQLSILHSLGHEGDASASLRSRLKEEYTPLQAVCIMLFCLISIPCVATIIATWKESGSGWWAVAQLAGLTVLAYGVCLIVYQSGQAMGWGVG